MIKYVERKTIKEKFITYLGNCFYELENINNSYTSFRNDGKYKFYIEMLIANFDSYNQLNYNNEEVILKQNEVYHYFLRFNKEFSLSFNDLTNDLLIIDPFQNEKYLNFIKDKIDILKLFRNKMLKKKLEKKLKIKALEESKVKKCVFKIVKI